MTVAAHNSDPPKTPLAGKYQLIQKIGSGGMGDVYEATHIQIGRKVAVKLLKTEHLADKKYINRFRKEAFLAGSIGHDNICEIMDVDTTDDGVPFMVMPLLKGHTLADLLKTGPLRLKKAAIILSQVLLALDAAHHKKIVHRDLKPSNIFITQFGPHKNVVKLLDFGISKNLDDSQCPAHTQTGSITGTSYYMSPEQARGSGTWDHRVDIYAAGVLLYEMLTGKKPFTGKSHNEILYNIISKSFVPPTLINNQISPDVENIILTAMQKHQDQRFSTAQKMQQALVKSAGIKVDTLSASTHNRIKINNVRGNKSADAVQTASANNTNPATQTQLAADNDADWLTPETKTEQGKNSAFHLSRTANTRPPKPASAEAKPTKDTPSPNTESSIRAFQKKHNTKQFQLGAILLIGLLCLLGYLFISNHLDATAPVKPNMPTQPAIVNKPLVTQTPTPLTTQGQPNTKNHLVETPKYPTKPDSTKADAIQTNAIQTDATKSDTAKEPSAIEPAAIEPAAKIAAQNENSVETAGPKTTQQSQNRPQAHKTRPRKTVLNQTGSKKTKKPSNAQKPNKTLSENQGSNKQPNSQIKGRFGTAIHSNWD